MNKKDAEWVALGSEAQRVALQYAHEQGYTKSRIVTSALADRGAHDLTYRFAIMARKPPSPARMPEEELVVLVRIRGSKPDVLGSKNLSFSARLAATPAH